ncbi:hypothetical protein MJG53_016940 [Ovis ammon polii x Ovis aries]|uniref:Uncharacterized protein n=1 Tax=Ovis ammon polii x Ovis aries TaxID=2918886 RepID=A0ACB9UAM6_9CETA|nr:hypothetical protein MJG53_016940 [Ovis ammon polii x Ovis aries]
MEERLEAGKESKASSMSVGLQGDSSLQVEISDAVSDCSGTRSFFKLAELFEQLRELEGQVASNKDLKLLDMLRYYMRDSQAAKVRGGPRANLRAGGQGAEPPGRAERHGPWVRDPVPLPAPGLLSWQLLALADYKNANKVLDKARTSNQVWAMESH